MDRLAVGKTREHLRNLGSAVFPTLEAVEAGCVNQLAKLRSGGVLSAKERKAAIKAYAN